MKVSIFYAKISRTARMSVVPTVCLFALMSALPANAAFTGYYALENFTLANQNANGTAALNGAELILTGGNNGSGLGGFTDLTIAAPTAGTVSFDFQYQSQDIPGVDLAGYKIGPVLHLLAFEAAQGSISFQVNANDVFGFRVGTEDNTFGPGVLRISNFSAPLPDSTAGVPEPGSFSLLAMAIALASVAKRRSRAHRNRAWSRGMLTWR